MQMAKAAIILSFLFLLSAILFCQHCDSIPWSKHHDLKWKYFKAQPDSHSKADALTDASIYYQISTAEKFARFVVTCSFYPCKSWVKSTSTYRLLEHEQTHFTIAEYHKRLLMKEIMNRKFTAANIFSAVQEIGKMITDLRKDMDEVYDLETFHSVNEDKQKVWTKKMNKLLKKLDSYEGGSYMVTLN